MNYFQFATMRNYLLAIVISLMGWPAWSQPFVVVFLNSKADKAELPKEEVDKIMDGHMANINRLAKEDKLITAGPFDGGGGIFIFNSGSKEEVSAWLETDPGIRAKRWDIEIFNYKPSRGSVCVVGEPYEMTYHTFVRYEVRVMTADMEKALKTHDLYLQQVLPGPDIIQEATFGASDGRILIVRGDLKRELIEQDPAVQNELLKFTIKKLYIAKGAFCEK